MYSAVEMIESCLPGEIGPAEGGVRRLLPGTSGGDPS